MNQKGFSKILIIIIAVVLLAGGMIYYLVNREVKPTIPESSGQQSAVVSTANWKTFKQETNLYEVKYPSDWNVFSGAGDSVGGDSFGFKTTSGGVDPIVSVAYFTSTYGEAQPKRILDEQTTLLDGIKAVRQTLIDSEGNEIIRIITTEKRDTLNFRIDLHKLDYLSTFDAMVQTFKFFQSSSQEENSNSNLVIRKDWAISFNKQSNWDLTNNLSTQIELKQVSGEWKGDVMRIQYVSGEKITDQSAKFGDITYWYDQSKGKWMRTGRTNELTGITEPAVVEATPEFYVAGNMPVFVGTGRWLTYIVPLSHVSFLKFNINGSGYTQPLTDLVKTISKL